MEERMAAKEEDFKKEHIKHQKQLEALQDANRVCVVCEVDRALTTFWDQQLQAHLPFL